MILCLTVQGAEYSPNPTADHRTLFKEACRFLDTHIDTKLVSVSVFDFSQCNIIKDPTWSALIAMLILTYPERDWEFDLLLHPPATLHLGPPIKCGTQLFDALGLRNLVRSTLDLPTGVTIQLRSNFALVLEDEPHYRMLHALMIYTRGIRCLTPESWLNQSKHYLNLGMWRQPPA